MRPVSLSDKVNDANVYKAYCCYRPGHPIKNIFVENEDLNVLKALWEKYEKKSDKKSILKLDSDLHEIQKTVPLGATMLQITHLVIKYYREQNTVMHTCNIRRLIWTIYAQENPEAYADHVMSEENLWKYLDSTYLKCLNKAEELRSQEIKENLGRKLFRTNNGTEQ